MPEKGKLMKAVILAGGKGERLRPMTCACPKPLVNFMDSTVLDGVLEMLARNGVDGAVVTSMFLPDMMEDFASAATVIPLECVREEMPLGTAGAVRNCSKYIDGTFIVVSGDCVTDINLSEAVKMHRSSGAEATVALIRQNCPTDFGVVCTDADGRITSFKEKPSWSEVDSPYCNAGIYIMEPSVLKLIPEGKSVDFSKDVFPLMLREKRALFGFPVQGYWCDIGDEQKYRTAHFDCLEGKCSLFSSGISANAVIGERVKILPPVYIGEGTVIEGESVIGSHTVIGRNCRIDGSIISGSVLWDGVEASGSDIRDSVICAGARLLQSSGVSAGCVIGEGCTVGRFALVGPGCRLWNGTVAEDETRIYADVRTPAVVAPVDASRLCRQSSARPEPEKILLLARAFAQERKRIAVTHDGGGLSQAVACLLMCGVSLSGAEGVSCDCGGMGQARYAVRLCEADGGIYVASDRNHIELILLDKRGCELTAGDMSALTRSMRSRVMPIAAGRIYTRSVKQKYFEYLINIAGGRAQGQRIALCGNDKAVEYAADALRKTGRNPIKAGNRDIGGVIRDEGCVFGAEIGPRFTLRGLYDQNGRRASYEQFIFIRARLGFYMGADRAVIPRDCSPECLSMLRQFGIAERAGGNGAASVASESWAELEGGGPAAAAVMDAAVFILQLCRFLSGRRKYLSEFFEKLPRSFESVARCPNAEKGRVMEQLREKKLGVRVVPDDSLAVLRIYASALSEEYARELVWDAQAVIDETVRHGQS